MWLLSCEETQNCVASQWSWAAKGAEGLWPQRRMRLEGSVFSLQCLQLKPRDFAPMQFFCRETTIITQK
jgi:hypothetical protein